MRSAFTVPLFCKELFVGDDALIGDDSGGYWRAQHGGALSGPVAFLLGIGTGCLGGLRAAVERADGPGQKAHLTQLESDLDAYRARFHDYTKRFVEGDRGDSVLDALLEIRVQVSTFVLRLAAIAIAAEGGRAHLRDNPAQRRLREASFFLTGTVNQSMREALILGL
jgi:alkylation response protein AidB-like acyl-CoA dehydrogenase